MEPLTDAVCQAAKWLKSSVERLSGNSRRASFRFCKRGQNTAGSAISPPLVPPNGGPEGSKAIYQTVSGRVILRSWHVGMLRVPSLSEFAFSAPLPPLAYTALICADRRRRRSREEHHPVPGKDRRA
jgi:hypothetical protein